MGTPRNKDNGPEGKKASMQRKAATSAKGRYSQSKGSSDHNTSPKYAKPMKNRKTDCDESMMF